MTVNELLAGIVAVSHNEDTPDTLLSAKAMQWLNAAYHEVIDECLPYLKRYLHRTETITTSLDVATLSTDAYRIVRVVDKTNGHMLREVTPERLIDLDPDSTTTGAPAHFTAFHNTLTLHPKPSENILLEVLYLPSVADLVANGDESSILLPRQFHQSLIWGGLVWSAIYERGFNTGGELQLFQSKWDEARQKIKLSLVNSPTNALRTTPYTLV